MHHLVALITQLSYPAASCHTEIRSPRPPPHAHLPPIPPAPLLAPSSGKDRKSLGGAAPGSPRASLGGSGSGGGAGPGGSSPSPSPAPGAPKAGFSLQPPEDLQPFVVPFVGGPGPLAGGQARGSVAHRWGRSSALSRVRGFLGRRPCRDCPCRVRGRRNRGCWPGAAHRTGYRLLAPCT